MACQLKLIFNLESSKPEEQHADVLSVEHVASDEISSQPILCEDAIFNLTRHEDEVHSNEASQHSLNIFPLSADLL